MEEVKGKIKVDGDIELKAYVTVMEALNAEFGGMDFNGLDGVKLVSGIYSVFEQIASDDLKRIGTPLKMAIVSMKNSCRT